jgi:hypothetical protein
MTMLLALQMGAVVVLRKSWGVIARKPHQGEGKMVIPFKVGFYLTFMRRLAFPSL